MRRTIPFIFTFCLFSLIAMADEQKKVLLTNDQSEQTIALGYCNIFARLNAEDEEGTVSIELENLDESKVLIVFDRAYPEKVIKKMSKSMSIVYDKTFGGKAKNRLIDPCTTPMEGVQLVKPSDKAQLTDVTVTNGENSVCLLPIYIAKQKGKKVMLLEKQLIELDIEADLKPSPEYIAMEDKFTALEKEIDRQTFCPNPKHKTSLEKQEAVYVNKINELKAEIDQLIASHNWKEEDGGYVRYTALKNKLDAIDLSSRERDCGRHKGGSGGGSGHSCSYCSLSLQQIYHKMDDYYKKIYSSSDRKAAKAKVIKEVNALYQCCTDPACSKHASAWKSGGEYKNKIIERYNRISNL